MLLVTDDLIIFCISHDGADYDVLKNFTRYTCERDGSVIFREVVLTFLEYRCDSGCSPIERDNASINRTLKDNSESWGDFVG